MQPPIRPHTSQFLTLEILHFGTLSQIHLLRISDHPEFNRDGSLARGNQIGYMEHRSAAEVLSEPMFI